ncbi:multidrug MFS transporter [Alteromonas sp. I4]|nr:multidrug MFS transporter [Alteromonas sp. I4]
MILVTVGVQLPFKRLIKKTLEIAKINADVDFVIQCGDHQHAELQNVKFISSVSEDDFNELISKCEFVVSHAGMGTILKALTLRKKIILVPRLASLNEHRNNHQIDTLRAFKQKPGIFPCMNVEDLLTIYNECKFAAPNFQESNNEKLRELRAYLFGLI